MRLLIISLMPHHLRDGQVVGWGPTVREIDHLATRFEVVRHIATLSDAPAPASDLAYSVNNVELVPVVESGAPGFLGKLDVLRKLPQYVRAMLRELPAADMVHVRAPASIALIAIALLTSRRKPVPRWFKYAGNWQPGELESPSYMIQRWWLATPIHRGIVTVNGAWPDQPSWVRTFYNPSLDDKDIERGRAVAATKSLGTRVRLLFIGRVETPKGTGRALEIVARLRNRGHDVVLDIVGGGPEQPEFERLATELGVQDAVSFLGWLPHTHLYELYGRSHVLLLPTSASEGWPKVLSEGMAYGVVPLAGAVSSIPQYLSEMRTGAAHDPHDLEAFVGAIEHYIREPARWKEESERAVEAARWFTFKYYLECIDRMLADLGLTS